VLEAQAISCQRLLLLLVVVVVVAQLQGQPRLRAMQDLVRQ
jgi:hypothetical protein